MPIIHVALSFCLFQQAAEAAKSEFKIIMLSDKSADNDNVPISSLLALGAVHQFLIRQVHVDTNNE